MKKCIMLFSLFVVSILYAGEVNPSGIKTAVEGEIHTNWHIDLKEDAEPLSQFELTRAYFGSKMTVAEKFTGRVMLDVERTNSVNADAKADPRLVAYLKYGYLEMADVIPLTTVTLGLQGLNQFKVQEKFWGYRYIYKSFMDQNKFGTSADLGLGISIKPGDALDLNINITNGEGYKKPQGSDGKYKAAFGSEFKIAKMLTMYLYGDVMPYDAETEKRPQGTIAAFLGYSLQKIFRVGAEYNFQANHDGAVAADYNGISVYADVTAKSIDIFVRGDVLSLDQFESTSETLIAGLQYSPIKNLAIAPNFQMIFPADGNKNPEPKIFINGVFKF